MKKLPLNKPREACLIVRELLSYEPKTGKLKWLFRDRKWFKDNRSFKMWNTRFAGKIAFTSSLASGHLTGRIFDRTYLAHRIIWLWMTGEWPDEIDHKDGCSSNNIWTNLEDGDHQNNMMNQRLPITNTTGVMGVALNNSGKKYQAYISFQGKRIHLGLFSSIEEATIARLKASNDYGFSPRHGCTS